MHLEKDQYYHFYNRTNNEELLFKSKENYSHFLERYRNYTDAYFSTLAYCLMPTHFHFIIYITSDEISELKKNIATLLSGYTKSINIMYSRHGSLFQPRSKAKLIDDEKYLLTLVSYVHQNPVRAKLVERMEDWQFSSYLDLIGNRNGTLPNREFYRQYFKTFKDFQIYSEDILTSVRKKYWV